LFELVLRFLLKPDVIRESIGMPYFRLITVCLSYLFERRPRLDLKDPTIAVVIAHRRKTKKGMQLCRIFSIDTEPCFLRFRAELRRSLVRQPVWRICFERAQDFAVRHNVRPYPAGVAVLVARAAVISIRTYQQREHVQVTVESSPVPSTSPANADRRIQSCASGDVHSPTLSDPPYEMSSLWT
jgi:hypothetical protein